MTAGGEPFNDDIALPYDAIVIQNQGLGVGTLEYTVSQTWKSNSNAGLAIQGGMGTCIVKGDVGFGSSESVTSQCIDGLATTTVVVYLDDQFEPDECEACNVADLSQMGGGYEFCAYRVELPCEPIIIDCGEPTGSPSVSPTVRPTSSPTSSPSSSPTEAVEVCIPPDGELISSEGETMYPVPPIKITFQNTTHVKFEVENTFATTVSSIFTEYHTGSFGETECLEEENVEEKTVIETEFIAQCMVHAKISVVNIWITDCNDILPFLDESDNAEVPECCHPGDQCRTVQYTFKLPCENPCPTLPPSVQASDSPTDSPTATLELINPGDGNFTDTDDNFDFGNATDAPTITDTEVAELEPPSNATDAPSIIDTGVAELEDVGSRKLERNAQAREEAVEEIETKDTKAEDHFCVVEDYPCGPSSDKVHVCHYSARDGYKTFCVPETDSDALRFYPKDYCGPCVGGYATA